MARIGLFRSECLNEQGQQVVKAIIIGDDMPDEMYDAFSKWLADPDDNLVVLNEGTQVGWLG